MTSTKNDHKRPLLEGETESVTIGCRHSNPDFCAKHSMAGVCAFVAEDNFCLEPSASWNKLYKKLLEDHK